MRRPDVHQNEMQDELLDDGMASFLDEVRSTYGEHPLPPPGAELSALFATGLTIDKGDRPVTAASNANGPEAQAAGLPKWTRRRNMLKQMAGSLAGKVTAGMTGAALAVGGLGVAGALPGPVQMAAANVADVVGVDLPAPNDATSPGTDAEQSGTEQTTTTTVPKEENDKPSDSGEAPASEPTPEDTTDATPGPYGPVPTSQSEAAHNHAFDEACGNHGAYVSHFARTGEEPQCAQDARKGQAGQREDGARSEDRKVVTDDEADGGAKQAKAEAKARSKQAKAEAKAAKRGAKRNGRGPK